jgi:hypothetical protein
MPQKWSVKAEIRAEQRAALEKMTRKEKLAYFWEYYRYHLLIGIMVLAVAINLITSIVNQKPYAFYAMMINSFELDAEAIQDEFGAYAGFDLQRTACLIDVTTFLNLDSLDQYNIASIQRVLALTSAGDLDVITSDGTTFTYFAEAELLMDLREVLSAEELALYEDNIFYIDMAFIERRKNDDNIEASDYLTVKSYEEKLSDLEEHRSAEEMETPVPVGIFIADAALIEATGAYPTLPPVFGISISSQRTEAGVRFLEFLWGRE